MGQTSFNHSDSKIQREFERLYQRIAKPEDVNKLVDSKVEASQVTIDKVIEKAIEAAKLSIKDDGAIINSNVTEIDFIDSDTVKFTANTTSSGVKITAETIETMSDDNVSLDPRVPKLYVHAMQQPKKSNIIGQYWFNDTSLLEYSTLVSNSFEYYTFDTTDHDIDFDLVREVNGASCLRIQKSGYYKISATYDIGVNQGNGASQFRFFIIKNPCLKWWSVNTYQELGTYYKHERTEFFRHAYLVYYSNPTHAERILYLEKGTDLAFATNSIAMDTNTAKHVFSGYFNIEYCGNK